MQCQRSIARGRCHARNAYNPSTALTSTFARVNRSAAPVQYFTVKGNVRYSESEGKTPSGLWSKYATRRKDNVEPPQVQPRRGRNVQKKTSQGEISQGKTSEGEILQGEPSIRLILGKGHLRLSPGEKTDTREMRPQIKIPREKIPPETIPQGPETAIPEDALGGLHSLRHGPLSNEATNGPHEFPEPLDSPEMRDWKIAFPPDVYEELDNYHKSHEAKYNPRTFWTWQMLILSRIIKTIPPRTSNSRIERNILDFINYYGHTLPLVDSSSRSVLPLPWVVTHKERDPMDNAIAVLDKEIERFLECMRVTEEEADAREQVIQDLEEFVAKIAWTQDRDKPIELRLFGSQKTGLAMPLSDLDFHLADHYQSGRSDVDHHRDVRVTLMYISQRLAKSPDSAFTAVRMRGKRFPIVVAQHRATGVMVQIVGHSPKGDQVGASKMLLDATPTLREIYAIMHTMLSARGGVDVYRGGIGSYGLFVLLATILRHGKTDAGKPLRDASLGVQLIGCLKFLAHHSFEDTTLSWDHSKPFAKHCASKVRMPVDWIQDAVKNRELKAFEGMWKISAQETWLTYMMGLQDPADFTNDLGARSYAIKHIQATAMHVWKNLEREIAALDTLKMTGEPWWGESLLFPLVSRFHEQQAAGRQRLREYSSTLRSQDEADNKPGKQVHESDDKTSTE